YGPVRSRKVKGFRFGVSLWFRGWGVEETASTYACRTCVKLSLDVGRGPFSKKLMLLEHQDIIAEFFSPSRWKELSKKRSSKIILCGDGSCWKTFKPIASLIAKGKLK
ncbi:hypothetical protein Tco_0233910, partial [Tanacetum coccineum]